MEEFPRQYEYVDGAVIMPRLAGQKIPIPPEWVRLRSDMPQRAKFACLSKEIAHLYPAQVREVLVRYVREWPTIRQSGTDLIIAGRVSTRKLRWAASAVVNEIVMRYGQVSALSTYWFSPGNLTWLVDAREAGAEEYAPIRNRILNRKLLFVENPLAIGENGEGRWFLQALYEHRYNNQLPTITTLPVDLNWGWDDVRKVLGNDVTDILRENHEDFLAHY